MKKPTSMDEMPLGKKARDFLERYGVSHSRIVQSRLDNIASRHGEAPYPLSATQLESISETFNTLIEAAPLRDFGALKHYFTTSKALLPTRLDATIPETLHGPVQEAFAWMTLRLEQSLAQGLKKGSVSL